MIRSWKRRYCFLAYGCMEYFEDYQAYQTNLSNGIAKDERHSDLDSDAPFRPKGGILLCGAVLIPDASDSLQLDIKCMDRTLTVRAADDSSMSNWHTQLQLHIDLANEDALCQNDVNEGVVKWLERIRQISAEAEGRLQFGHSFNKYYASLLGVKSHRRTFYLNDASDALCWSYEGGDRNRGKAKSIGIASFHSVEKGCGNMSTSKGKPECCFRIVTGERDEINIECATLEVRDAWVADLYCVCYNYSLKLLQVAVGTALAKQMSTPKMNLKKAIAKSER